VALTEILAPKSVLNTKLVGFETPMLTELVMPRLPLAVTNALPPAYVEPIAKLPVTVARIELVSDLTSALPPERPNTEPAVAENAPDGDVMLVKALRSVPEKTDTFCVALNVLVPPACNAIVLPVLLNTLPAVNWYELELEVNCSGWPRSTTSCTCVDWRLTVLTRTNCVLKNEIDDVLDVTLKAPFVTAKKIPAPLLASVMNDWSPPMMLTLPAVAVVVIVTPANEAELSAAIAMFELLADRPKVLRPAVTVRSRAELKSAPTVPVSVMVGLANLTKFAAKNCVVVPAVMVSCAELMVALANADTLDDKAVKVVVAYDVETLPRRAVSAVVPLMVVVVLAACCVALPNGDKTLKLEPVIASVLEAVSEPANPLPLVAENASVSNKSVAVEGIEIVVPSNATLLAEPETMSLNTVVEPKRDSSVAVLPAVMVTGISPEFEKSRVAMSTSPPGDEIVTDFVSLTLKPLMIVRSTSAPVRVTGPAAVTASCVAMSDPKYASDCDVTTLVPVTVTGPPVVDEP